MTKCCFVFQYLWNNLEIELRVDLRGLHICWKTSTPEKPRGISTTGRARLVDSKAHLAAVTVGQEPAAVQYL